MTVSVYRRDEQGLITFEGPQDYSSVGAFLILNGLDGIAPQEERLKGWPHSYVRWYARPDAPTQAAVGIGG